MKNTVFLWTNYYKEHPEIGTTNKIIAEIEQLRNMGFSVTYTAYLEDGVAVYNNDDVLIDKKRITCTIPILGKVIRRNALINIAIKHIETHSYDYCMLRINELTRSYMKMLKMMKSKSFVMMESLSYFPNMKFSDVKGLDYYAILASIKRNKNRLKDSIDLMLTEGIIDDFYGIPCVEFGMGVNVDYYTPHKYMGNKDEINMLMVGCKSLYHGTDRIIKSLIDYYTNTPNDRIVKLHLVGGIFKSDEVLLSNPVLNGRVFNYGKKYGAELDEIYNKCNIALGPLAQHRMKKKDTGLKTKEYFAKGIPYIYSGEEVLIEKDYPYIKKIEDSENLIDISDIIKFVDILKNKGDVAQDMRMKAREVFPWSGIFNRVFSKINQIKSIQQ